MSRFILHLDMDAFYASVEQRDNPELRGKPVAIGSECERGVVSTASYEARRFGVHSAMPCGQARKLCPELIFVPVRIHRYMEVSRQVMSILDDFSPCVEQASIDEAYLDITGTERLYGPPEQLAASMKKRILAETGLTCSVGGAPVRFLAKIASDYDKPDGITMVYPDMVHIFLQELPIGKIPGVGKKTLEILKHEGIFYAPDMLKKDQRYWINRLGKQGAVLYSRVQGIDDSPVNPVRECKSVSAEATFGKDTADYAVLKTWLLAHSERVGTDLRKKGLKGRTITLKIKYHNFRQTTRSISLPRRTCETSTIYKTACRLLFQQALAGAVRLIGVGVSGFSARPVKLSLLEEPSDTGPKREERLDRALDAVREKFGKAAVQRAGLFEFTKKGK